VRCRRHVQNRYQNGPHTADPVRLRRFNQVERHLINAQWREYKADAK
jgi:hypothetical protein